jgi:hypothetical protein
LQKKVEDRITTFAILKKRQPEVAIIVVVGLLRWLGPMGTSLTQNSILKSGSSLIMLAVAAVMLLLRAGFLRTAYLYGGKGQRIVTLLQTGKRFFWHLFIFACLCGIILVAPTLLIKGILGAGYLSIGLGIIVLRVVLMKPLLLVPAMIIVHKMQVFDALGSFMTYKILEAKELLTLFAAQQVFGLLSLFARPLLEKGSITYLFMSAITNIVGTLLIIAIALSAVLFIAKGTNLAIEDTEKGNGDEFTE